MEDTQELRVAVAEEGEMLDLAVIVQELFELINVAIAVQHPLVDLSEEPAFVLVLVDIQVADDLAVE